MRLFASLPLPEGVSEHLDAAVRAVDAAAPDSGTGRGRPALRWVPPEQRHITLAFYGEVPSGAVDALTGELQDALSGVAPFPVRLRGAGVFSGRTLWAGVQEAGVQESGVREHGVQASSHQRASAGERHVPGGHSRGATPLMELMAAAEAARAPYARNPEAAGERDRRRAHVTLARARDRRKGERELRRRAEALAVYEGPVWTVREAQLMLSELGQGRSGGPLHTELARIPLAHSAAG